MLAWCVPSCPVCVGSVAGVVPWPFRCLIDSGFSGFECYTLQSVVFLFCGRSDVSLKLLSLGLRSLRNIVLLNERLPRVMPSGVTCMCREFLSVLALRSPLYLQPLVHDIGVASSLRDSLSILFMMTRCFPSSLTSSFLVD